MKSPLEYQFLLQDPEEEYMKFKTKLYKEVFYVKIDIFLYDKLSLGHLGLLSCRLACWALPNSLKFPLSALYRVLFWDWNRESLHFVFKEISRGHYYHIFRICLFDFSLPQLCHQIGHHFRQFFWFVLFLLWPSCLGSHHCNENPFYSMEIIFCSCFFFWKNVDSPFQSQRPFCRPNALLEPQNLLWCRPWKTWKKSLSSLLQL